MANAAGQPQFRWHLSLIVSLVLTAVAARADDIKPSGYGPLGGDRFYVLSEATFSSDEEALVRVEAPQGENAEAYNGVDVRLYRVPDALNFLKKQKNLHRPSIEGTPAQEGLGNALSYLWDSWYKKSRLVWQRVVAAVVRSKAVATAPQLKQAPPYSYRTPFQNPAQFKPIPGLELVDQFRYPLFQAKPIEPPAGAQVEGSTLTVKPGNARIPLGKLKPGLYLTEALIGSFRATCFLFVSDTVALTKLSSQQELVWTVRKDNGAVVPDVHVLLTDGLGVMADGKTDAQGVYVLNGKSLERSYVLGQDKEGGVVVSENFYFDSEIFSNKIYVVTDRPLYQPGDSVQVKILGREFQSSLKSTALANAVMHLTATDPSGVQVADKTLALPSLIDGAGATFTLPEGADAGGYALRLDYRGTTYAAAFRVARYVKPHFMVDVNFDKSAYKTGEEIKGNVQLTYGNGEAVKNAQVELEVRQQRLTIVAGEVEAMDRFPIEVKKLALTSDGGGRVNFDIPAAQESTRFTVTVKAADASSFRVSATKDLLVQLVAHPLALKASAQFSQLQDKVTFRWDADKDLQPVRWEAIRLEDRSQSEDSIKKGVQELVIPFAKAGHYSVRLLNEQGLVIGSVAHKVLGPELTTIPGTLALSADKAEYAVGDKAQVALSFSEPVQTALITMELDKVERYTLMSATQSWISLKKVNDQQYIAEIPIEASYSPNITLSVAYVSKGQYVFENKGLKVKIPTVKIAVQADKKEYKPGETVQLSLQTTYQGKPVPAVVTLGVVDEMVYVLQPDVAPSIIDFFFHPRRDQVRTASSLSFHSYDAAVSALVQPTMESAPEYAERSFKVRVRPRREDRDTAFWAPTLRTDAEGKAQVTFVMPDALTRWRVTARAMTADGWVGQQTEMLQSHKAAYLKWTGANEFREGDQAEVQLAVFNMLDAKRALTLEVKGAKDFKKDLTLEPGANYVSVPQTFKEDAKLLLSLRGKEGLIDQLEVPVRVQPTGWSVTRKVDVTPDFQWPARASGPRLFQANPASDVFLDAVDSMMEPLCGCIEAYASSVIALSLAELSLKKAPQSPEVETQISRRLLANRTRLIRMAEPDARFTWWGQGDVDLFITVYAYYADWWATQALGIKMPKEHWESLLEMYARDSDKLPPFSRALVVWMLREMNLPTQNLLKGLLEDVAKDGGPERDPLFGTAQVLQNTILLLSDTMARKDGIALPQILADKVQAARDAAAQSDTFDKILLLLNGAPADKAALVSSIKDDWGWLEKGFGLAMLYKVMDGSVGRLPADGMADPNGWKKNQSLTGKVFWTSFEKPNLAALPPPPTGGTWRLQYDSFDEVKSKAPVEVSRQLFKLVPADKALSYTLEPVTKPWKLDPKELYLDRVEVKSQGWGATEKFGLVTVALPPGGSVEETTWGLTVKNAEGAAVDLQTLGLQSGNGYYSRPIEQLMGKQVLNQLVRFAQAGQYTIPGVRFQKMYEPGQVAFEGGSSTATQKIRVE